MIPTTGGDYIYLGRAYGETAAFSFSWYYFWVAKPGSQAIIATVFGNYFVTVFTGLDNANGGDKLTSTLAKVCAVVLVAILTGLNCLGVKETSGVVNVLTGTKIALIVCVFVVGITFVCIHQDSDTAR